MAAGEIRSEVLRDDHERDRSEHLGERVAEIREFLTGIEPGDLRAFATRMRERWPYYRTIVRLDPASLPSA